VHTTTTIIISIGKDSRGERLNVKPIAIESREKWTYMDASPVSSRFEPERPRFTGLCIRLLVRCRSWAGPVMHKPTGHEPFCVANCPVDPVYNWARSRPARVIILLHLANRSRFVGLEKRMNADIYTASWWGNMDGPRARLRFAHRVHNQARDL